MNDRRTGRETSFVVNKENVTALAKGEVEFMNWMTHECGVVAAAITVAVCRGANLGSSGVGAPDQSDEEADGPSPDARVLGICISVAGMYLLGVFLLGGVEFTAASSGVVVLRGEDSLGLGRVRRTMRHARSRRMGLQRTGFGRCGPYNHELGTAHTRLCTRGETHGEDLYPCDGGERSLVRTTRPSG